MYSFSNVIRLEAPDKHCTKANKIVAKVLY